MSNTGEKAVAATNADAEAKKQKFVNRMADSHTQLQDVSMEILEHLGRKVLELPEPLYNKLMGAVHNAAHVEAAAKEFTT